MRDSISKRFCGARGTLEAALKKYRTVSLPIINEIGFMRMDEESANIFFRVSNERYEKAATIMTTNLPFSQWSNFMPDAQLS